MTLRSLHNIGSRMTAVSKTEAAVAFASPDLSPGLVWPPVGGRESLAAIRESGLDLAQRPNGEWTGSAGDWRVYLAVGSRFESAEAGRETLVEWAGWHGDHANWLSAPRCLALAPQPDGTALLWQAVRRNSSLLDGLTLAFENAPAVEIASALVRATERVVRLHETIAPTGLRVTIANTADSSHPTYLDWAPTPRGLRLRPANFAPRPLSSTESFSQLFDGRLAHWRSRLPDLARLLEIEQLGCRNPAVATNLASLTELFRK